MFIMFGWWTGSLEDVQGFFYSLNLLPLVPQFPTIIVTSCRDNIVIYCLVIYVTLLNEENLLPNPYQMDRYECRPHNKPSSNGITYTLCYLATPFGNDYSQF